MNQLYLENFYLQLVNREHPARQTPDTARLLAPHPDYPDILMEAYAARALHRLLNAIHGFQEIALVSGFRSHKEQIDIWESCEREHASMKPGLPLMLPPAQNRLILYAPAFQIREFMKNFGAKPRSLVLSNVTLRERSA